MSKSLTRVFRGEFLHVIQGKPVWTSFSSIATILHAREYEWCGTWPNPVTDYVSPFSSEEKSTRKANGFNQSRGRVSDRNEFNL
jgi:hypothetical protein